jgi:hypothetical protein
MYTAASTKQIFEKLAHSSIMRLNKSSMDKLYDLMNMGFKRQIVMCSSPHQYLVVTLNHLESIKRLVDDAQVHELIQVAIDKSVAMYSTLTEGQLMSLKYSLLRFLQDKKVKVSLFLQQELQTSEGALVLTVNNKLPRGVETPGTIRYYENGSVVSTRSFDTPNAQMSADTRDVMDIKSNLGLNMYIKDAGAKEVQHPSEFADSYLIAMRAMTASRGGASSSSGASSGPSAAAGPKSSSAPSSPAKNSSSASLGLHSSAKNELSLLADLLGKGDSGAKGAVTKGFRINLFPDSSYDDKEGGGDYGGVIRFEIDGTADAKSLSSYLEELDLSDEKAASKGAADDDDDLLALMDSAK